MTTQNDDGFDPEKYRDALTTVLANLGKAGWLEKGEVIDTFRYTARFTKMGADKMRLIYELMEEATWPRNVYEISAFIKLSENLRRNPPSSD